MPAPYWFRESFSGFKRAKLSTTVTVITVAIALILLGIFSALTLNATKLIDDFREQVQLEVFISESVSKEDANEIAALVSRCEFSRRVEFISKAKAAEIFKQEFGEDIIDILGMNPLPMSLKISVWPSHASQDSLEGAIRMIRAVVKARYAELSPVLDIRYNKEFLLNVEKNAKRLTVITIAIGVIIALSSIALVSNTIRLAIYAKREMIRTMKLVGATSFFIRIPFLIEGIFQGLLGGLLALAALNAMTVAVKEFAPLLYEAIHVQNPVYYLVLLLLGALFGFLGSSFSIRKFISE